MSDTVTSNSVDEDRKANTRKREITATVTAAVVTVILGAAATGVISKISDRVHNRIAPKTEKPEDEN